MSIMSGIVIMLSRCGVVYKSCCPLQILQQLDQCKGYPDFNNYLAFIFAQGDSLDIEVRPA